MKIIFIAVVSGRTMCVIPVSDGIVPLLQPGNTVKLNGDGFEITAIVIQVAYSFGGGIDPELKITVKPVGECREAGKPEPSEQMTLEL